MRTRSETTAGLLLSIILIAAAATAVAAPVAAQGSAQHPVVGHFSVQSEAGGAVWAFRPDGRLVVSGPGELMAEGQWTSADGERDFDANVDLQVNGQQLVILGTVSPDGLTVAMLVDATAAADATAAVPWPARSQLIGERLGMVAEATPSTPPLDDCQRPAWTETGAVDWDRCAGIASPSPLPQPSASPTTQPAVTESPPS